MINDTPQLANVQIERCVTSCMLSGDLELIDKYIWLFTELDFTDPICMNVIKAIRTLRRAKQAVDIITVVGVYKHNTDAVAQIMLETVTSANISSYVNQLKEISAKRALMRVGHDLICNVEGEQDINSCISNYQTRLDDIQSAVNSNQGMVDLCKTEGVLIQDGVSAGFITWDYNDSGLKGGRLTLCLGARGHGKTTMARQMIMSVARQKVKSFYFCGETSIKEEKSNLARLGATEGEINTKDNLAGRTLYYPAREAGERFNREYAPYINLCDTSISNTAQDLWATIKRHITTLASEGVKVFLIDSMMVLNNASGSNKFTEQKEIVQWLKSLGTEYGVHIVLIVHPSKHHAGTSGVQEQENLADTILRYVRLFDDTREAFLRPCTLPECDQEKISAVVYVEKIRDQGHTDPMYLEWNQTRGAVVEVTDKAMALKYENDGHWVRRVSRDEDVPDYGKQYSN